MTLYRQGKVPGSLLRRLRPGGRLRRRDVGDGRRRTACASCTATSPRTSSAASSPRRIFAQYMGREGGITGGRDGNVHFGDRTKGCVGMVSMLPDMMLIATGLAMAFKLRGEQRVRDHLVRRRLDLARRLPRGDELGRRAEAAGHLHPREQPVRVLDAARPAVRGRPGRARGGLRLPGRQRSTATTPRRCSRPSAQARERALAGEGPTLIEAVTMRMHGHAAHDDMKYVPERAGRGVARARTRSTARSGASRRSASTSPRCATRSRRRSTPPSRRRWQSPMPDGDTATDRAVRRRAGAARGRQRARGAASRKASA